MFERLAKKKLKELARKFPIVAVTGPRQSGKTTLVQATFPKYAYLSLEDLDVRLFAKDDPRGFLQKYPNGVILDEVQHVPELFSYLQTIADSRKQMGKYVLTGSQNFQLLEKISQSLAGRVGLIELLPFALSELRSLKKPQIDLDAWIFRGFYPPIYDRKINPSDWYSRYIQTYIDRDVRSIKSVSNMSTFQRFVKMCAGRIGSLLNINNLANECGISLNTAKAWLSILEASYIIFLLKPHHRNFNKRLVKQSKLYFYDTGVACTLLGLESSKQLNTHYLRGSLFENMVIVEYLKQRLNQGLPSNLYFWRDHVGAEIDLILEVADRLKAIEIKSSSTLNPSLYAGLKQFQKISATQPSHCRLIYSGKTMKTSHGHATNWGDLFHAK